jgi:uncharacterized protein YndB with AHSA1/START domain
MKHFDWTCFTRKILVKATLAEVYDAWTKASEIEKWFLSSANYFGKNHELLPKETPVRAGDSYEWGWFLYNETETGNITAANGKDLLAFSFAGDCQVEVKLSETDDHVLVELTQKNIPTDDDSKLSIRLGCHSGWSFYLVNLKSVCEGGLDLRNKNAHFKPMVNN